MDGRNMLPKHYSLVTKNIPYIVDNPIIIAVTYFSLRT